MGKSAVLSRSFSHPSGASREASKGDPICALTESVSFGRFMSESLAWEKWSTFSHNRYLEEVEKFAKPGSVAEKKAYFEAHFKRKAAMKVAVFEEANAAAHANDASLLKTTNEILNNSCLDTESAKEKNHQASEVKEHYMAYTSTESPMDTVSADMRSHVVTEEQWKNDSPNSVAAPADAEALSSIDMRDNLRDVDVERGKAVLEYAINEENPTQVGNLKQLQNPDVHDKIEASHVDRMPNKNALYLDNSAPSSKKKHGSSSSKSSSQSGVFRYKSFRAKQTPSLLVRNINNIGTNSDEPMGDTNGKWRVIAKSLHNSINFSHCISETSKASLEKPKGSAIPIQTPTRASVNGGSKHLSTLFQSEDKRSKALVSKSVSGGITEDWKLQSLPMESSKSSSATSSKQPPFSFRSRERAAKWKESSRMLEEKKHAKVEEKAPVETRLKEKTKQDTKKWQRQTSIFEAKCNEYLYRGSHLPTNHIKKEKAEHDTEKLQQGNGFKPKPNESLNDGSPSPSNHRKKKPLCQPCSPKLGVRPTSTAVHDARSRPPRRPSVNTGSSKHGIEKIDQCSIHSIFSLPNIGRRPTSKAVQDANTRSPWRSSMNSATFKRVIEKNNWITNRSVTSLPKKKSRENVSPNIH